MKHKNYKPTEDNVRSILISEIHSNSQNPRESIPQLISLGYGLFSKLEGYPHPSLVSLALSPNSEDKAEFVRLIDSFEPSIADMAADITVNRMIHPVRVRPLQDGYDLIVGCRRVLASLYNSCKLNIPARVQAIVTEIADRDAMYMAFSENAHRMNMSPIEQAKWFLQMKNIGLSIQEISEKTKIGDQVVRQRLELLKLPQNIQDKVHHGDLGVVKALNIVKGNIDPTDSSLGKGSNGNGSRRKVPTISAFQYMYENDQDLHEKVREFIAVHILSIPYISFNALQTEKKNVEAAAKKITPK